MIKNVFFLIFSSAILFSCGEEKKSAFTKEQSQSQITDLEKELYSGSKMFNDSAAIAVVELYNEYADTYPEDSLSADYLFKAGEVSMGLNQAERSLHYFKKVCDKYPEAEKASFSLFLQAYVLDNYINDRQAGEVYRSFIEKYPNHPMVKDAEFSIQNLGKSDEELIKEFQAKQNKEEA
ncbi:MAG: tetratricopeptide repeat protein [Bacteroidota bacterium]|nr:tetratricopeptide repeat protein [Bacteroidota bacterium]